MIDESLKAFGRHSVGVRPGGIAKDLGEASGVGLLNLLHDLLQDDAVVFGGSAHVGPVAAVGNDERVEVGSDVVADIGTERLDGLCLLLVPGVAKTLEEEEGEDEISEVGWVNGAAKDVRCFPKPTLDVLLGWCHCHAFLACSDGSGGLRRAAGKRPESAAPQLPTGG